MTNHRLQKESSRRRANDHVPSCLGLGGRRRGANRRGAMVVLIAVTIIILLIGAMFSVDVAYMHVVKAELRTATDAAARAGAATLARTQDANRAVLAAK